MIISDGMIKIECANCGIDRTEAEFNLGMHYMWANQYGKCIRVFCHTCGGVTDYEELRGELSIHIQNWKTWVKSNPTIEEEIVGDVPWNEDDDEYACTETVSTNGLCPCCGDELGVSRHVDYEDIAEITQKCKTCSWESDPHYE